MFRSATGSLIPAGTELHKAKQITWPESQFTMSLVGFDHVFSDSEAVELAPNLRGEKPKLPPRREVATLQLAASAGAE